MGGYYLCPSESNDKNVPGIMHHKWRNKITKQNKSFNSLALLSLSYDVAVACNALFSRYTITGDDLVI